MENANAVYELLVMAQAELRHIDTRDSSAHTLADAVILGVLIVLGASVGDDQISNAIATIINLYASLDIKGAEEKA